MWKAIQNDEAGKLEELLAKGGKTTELSKKGEGVLFACVDSEAHECLRLLLSKNVDVAATDKEGATAMIRAVKAGDVQSLELLASRSSKVLLQGDNDGLTPLHWAVRLSELPVLQQLLSVQEVRREMLTRVDKLGYAPIHTGVQLSSSEDVLMALLEADKEQLELCEKQHGRTPLLMAAAYANQEAFALLLRAGASVNAIDKSSKTVLHLAAQSQEIPQALPHKDIERLVLSPDVDGNTPLHLAALHADETLYAELKKYGANELRVNLAGLSAATLLKNALQNLEKEDQEAVAQLQREAAEKERARLESEAAKQRMGATIEAKFAEKNAAKYAQRLARRERQDGDKEPESQEEEHAVEEEEPAPKHASPAPKPGSRVVPAPKPKPAGRTSIVWMAAVIVLFLAIFVASKMYGKSTRRPQL